MSLAQAKSVALLGLDGHVVNVEVDIADGLPGYSLLGLPDAALSESRDRVRSAIVNCGEIWPNRKVTVSLSPAWLPKSGSNFDLAICITLLSAHETIHAERIESIVFLGELSLDGHIRPVRGVLPSLIAAFKAGIRTAVVPMANALEAQLMQSMTIIPMAHLREVLQWLRTGERESIEKIELKWESSDSRLDFADVAGQSSARLAAEIAAIGGHHILLIAPPGAGKTMIAERIPTIMPALSIEQAIEVTAVHSIAGSLLQRSPVSLLAPIISPHHTTTRVAMVGGGSHVIKPGACSLAHHGVLFINEAPECASGVLDSLRQPLESGTITIARSIGNLTFPAQFLLVLAANPCPCGKFTGRGRNCTCTAQQVRRYLGKLSGPMMDRIDLRVQVEPVGRIDMAKNELGESSKVIRARVIRAREISSERFAGMGWSLNSQIPARALRTIFQPEKSAMNFLHDELDKEAITARGLHKIIRTAWSFADLRENKVPTMEDVLAAHTMRGKIQA